MKIKLLIVDDHSLVREGLQSIFMKDADIETIDEAGNGLEAILKAGKNKPDVVVMDYDMPKYNGIYGTRELLKQQPGTPVLLLTLYKDKEHILEAINAGVKGYISKEAKCQEILAAIKALHTGNSWFKGEIAEMITQYLIDSATGKPRRKANKVLTARETEIACLFAEGDHSTEIGDKLGISKRTVEVHKTNIFKKLNLKSNTELLRYAIRNNMIKIT